MRCPHCGSHTRQPVKETRRTADGRISRRRRCPDCWHDFLTLEQLSETGLQVLKADGRIVAFNRKALRESIKRAAVREYDDKRLEQLLDAVVADIYPLSTRGPIPSAAIGQAVLRHLREIDEVSQIRFQLVHEGRQDRGDERTGWNDVNDVRRWLIQEYPQLEYCRPSAKLVSVVKRNGEREPFDRKKLERGIDLTSKGRGSRDEVWQLAVDVASDVEAALGDQPMVTSGQIAAEIMRSLRTRDHIAYLRYASTAKRYESPEDYEAEALALRRMSVPPPGSTAPAA